MTRSVYWLLDAPMTGANMTSVFMMRTRVDRPPDILTLGDLGYLGTSLEIPLKTSKKKTTYERRTRIQYMAFKTTHWRRARYWPHEKVQYIFGYSPQQPTTKHDCQECRSTRKYEFEKQFEKNGWGYLCLKIFDPIVNRVYKMKTFALLFSSHSLQIKGDRIIWNSFIILVKYSRQYR